VCWLIPREQQKARTFSFILTVNTSVGMAVHFSSTNSAPATPKRRRMSPGGDGSDWGLTWGWTNPATPGDSPLQDDDLFQSPEACSGRGSSLNSAENKRGRPRADMITGLIEEGAVSPSAIKCKFCSRVFPREKSLQAHLRTHTGESSHIFSSPNFGAFRLGGSSRFLVPGLFSGYSLRF
jgi:hypothetical protein